jgi:hypothetical protein
MTNAQRLSGLVCRVAGVAAMLCAAGLIATTSATFSASVTPNPKLSGANPHVALGSPNPHVDGADPAVGADTGSPDLKCRH